MMERLPDTDPDAVLRAMEEGLREVSTEVLREGSRITLAGLGPSPRIKNRRDRTVIEVRAEDGVTTVEVDVTYQASAFLGDASQDAVVQAKLGRIFEEMRMQLGLPATERVPVAVSEPGEAAAERFSVARYSAEINGNGAHGGESPVALAEKSASTEAEKLVEAVPVAVVMPASVAVLEVPEETAAAAVATSAATGTPPEASVVVIEEDKPAGEETQVIGLAKDGLVKDGPAKDEPAKEVQGSSPALVVPGELEVVRASSGLTPPAVLPLPGQPSAAASLVLVEREKTVSIASGLAAKEKSARSPEIVKARGFSGSLMNSAPEEEPAGSSRLLRWSAWIAAIIVLVLAPAAWLYLPQHFGAETEQRAPSAAPQNTQQATVPPAPAVLQPPVATEPVASQPGSEEDPEAVVKDWESAMRATDADKQAAFYADPVERYFLRHNVAKDQVVADKQAAIDRRQGEWSVTMERVAITQHKDSSTAVVRLVKHFSVRQDGKLTSQWFIPSQLQMKRADGRWQITSERDLGWVNSMDELE
jgi:ketosteroid isomerase-like protein